ARSTSWVRASISGIVTAPVGLGRRVREGERLATITDPLGTQEEPVTAPFDGLVIGASRLPLAHEGDALFHLAAFSSMGRVENAVEEFVSIHDPALGRRVEDNLLET
ncbi:MAG: succinylglutamate desuccinylase/aspartoacylase family protein, partial [Gammaproteobacteria bacterium]|nr:succinylglutamate desuccinylase/aspartoacylase family protein [Gammaproteobacteria bacterium]